MKLNITLLSTCCILLALYGASSVAGRRAELWGDPHFIAFDGTKFDFQGHANRSYVLLTEPNHQVNAFFIPADVDDGNYPTGTYMGKMVVKTKLAADDVEISAEIKGYTWMEVAVNGNPVTENAIIGDVTLKVDTQFESVVATDVISKITITTPLFRFEIGASTGYKYNNGTHLPSAATTGNLHETPYLSFAVSLLHPLAGGTGNIHGLVGHTLQWFYDPASSSNTTRIIGEDSLTHPTDIQEFESYLGTIEEWFVVADVFSTDCPINRFGMAKPKKIIKEARRMLESGVKFPITAMVAA